MSITPPPLFYPIPLDFKRIPRVRVLEDLPRNIDDTDLHSICRPLLVAKKGEIIKVVDRYSNTVWIGAVDNRQGAFRLDKRVQAVLQSGERLRASHSWPGPLREDDLLSLEGDLAFAEGDVIEVLRLLDDHWWLWGRLNDRTGAVPVNFMELVEGQTSQPGPLNDADGAPSMPTPRLRVRTLFNYGVKIEGDLNFESGDIIEVVEKHGNGWWDGILAGQRGQFPCNYTTFSISPSEDIVKKSVRPPYCPYYVRALYAYSATVMDELSFSAGEIIEVYDMAAAPWLEGRTRTGSSGLFPVNYTIRVMDRRTPFSKVYVASPQE